jgi:hypothetical protein
MKRTAYRLKAKRKRLIVNASLLKFRGFSMLIERVWAAKDVRESDQAPISLTTIACFSCCQSCDDGV